LLPHPDEVFHSPAFIQLQRDGLYLLIDPNSPNWLSTNGAGAALLRKCDGRHTFVELTRQLRRPGISLSQARRGAAQFLRQARENGFLSSQPQVQPPYPGRGRALLPGRLSEVWIYTNNTCNLRCSHCLVSAGESQVPQLSTEEIKSLIDASRTLGATRFYFTGGEPFLRPDLLELVDWITRESELVILTNATLVDEEFAIRLAHASRGRLLLQVSLEGPNPQVNDALRGPGAFERAARGISHFASAGLIPVVSTVLSRVNSSCISDITRLAGQLGAAFHHIIWLHNRGRAARVVEQVGNPSGRSPSGRGLPHQGCLWVEPEEVAQIMLGLKGAAREAGVILDNDESLQIRAKAKRGRKTDLCNCCFETLCVNSDGRVYPCPALAGEPAFECGSIRENRLAEIWRNSPRMNWIRSTSVQMRTDCAACWLKFFCGGGCFAHAYLDYQSKTGTGSLLAPDPYCQAYQTLFQETLFELADGGVARPASRAATAAGGLAADFQSASPIPQIYAAMEAELPPCVTSDVMIADAAFEVAGFHCSCVLAMQAANGECCPGGAGLALKGFGPKGFKPAPPYPWLAPGPQISSVGAQFIAPAPVSGAGFQPAPDVQRAVKEFYRARSRQSDPRLCCPTGYRPEDLAGLPEEVTSVSYGCGNPVAFDDLKPGETVVDIGCGAGIDCFIAVRRVGESGLVIGVDMTEEMLAAAQQNAARIGAQNVQFRQGLAEKLPVESASADMVMSNCVINLSPDKPAVFREIARVLKDGGRMIVSDIVSSAPVPQHLREDKELWSQCISGAIPEIEYRQAIKAARLSRIKVLRRQQWQEIEGLRFYSITLRAQKCGPDCKC